MAIHRFEERIPIIGEGSWVAESADVLGDCRIGRGCFIGPGARLRGDYGTIVIGDGTAVEDNCVIHARPGEVCTLGRMVTVGHGAVIHNAASIGDWAVVGMRAVVSDWAVLGEWAVIGEGAVVRNRQEIPARAIAVGVPARIIGSIEEAYIAEWTRFKQIYVDLARRYPEGLVRLD